MAKKLILGGLLGGAVVWVWGAISWMLLPWHLATLNSFTGEDPVAEVVRAHAKGTGIYMYPFEAATAGDEAAQKAMEEKMARGPIFIVAYSEQGSTGMAKPMAIGFALSFVGALLITWAVLKTQGLTYGGKVCFVAVLALAAGVFTHLTYWNWMGFETTYTLVMVADLVVSGLLAGLVIGKVAS